MPRLAYKKHFARDRDGNYAGTEPEKEWSREDLDREFGEFQDMPLRSIPGGSEYGEVEWDRDFRVPRRGTGILDSWDVKKAGEEKIMKRGFGQGPDGGRPMGAWRA